MTLFDGGSDRSKNLILRALGHGHTFLVLDTANGLLDLHNMASCEVGKQIGHFHIDYEIKTGQSTGPKQ